MANGRPSEPDSNGRRPSETSVICVQCNVLVKVSSLVRLVLSQLCRLRVLKIAGIVYIYERYLEINLLNRSRN